MEKVLLFHLPCLCEDFQDYFTTKLHFISFSLHLKMFLVLLYLFYILCILSYGINGLKNIIGKIDNFVLQKLN